MGNTRILLLAAFALITVTVSAGRALAAATPISVSLVPPLEFPPEEFSTTGVRISALWGRHHDMYGLDLGLLGNITEKDFVGIGLSGAFNYTQGTTRILGLQLAGLANINKEKTMIFGLQAALGVNSNTASSTLVGIELAAANIAPFTDVYGMQLGIYNKALDVYGLQIGLVNVASSLHGVQIGLVNFNAKGPFSISPLINVGF